MLLPDKHIKISESILGLGGLVSNAMRERMSFDGLMVALAPRFGTPEWPAYHTPETVSLALSLLYMIGTIDVADNGELYRCD